MVGRLWSVRVGLFVAALAMVFGHVTAAPPIRQGAMVLMEFVKGLRGLSHENLARLVAEAARAEAAGNRSFEFAVDQMLAKGGQHVVRSPRNFDAWRIPCDLRLGTQRSHLDRRLDTG